MTNPMSILAAVLAALAILAAPAGANPRPDAAPQAHGKPVMMLPNCPHLSSVHRRSYVVESVNGQVVCAGDQG